MDEWNDFGAEAPSFAGSAKLRTPDLDTSPVRSDDTLGSAGDLESATDYEDIGVSEHATTSSSVRYHEPYYTKLEVIVSRDIEKLISFFHGVVAVSVCLVLVSIIVVNVLFAENSEARVNSALLSQRQKDWSVLNFGAVEDGEDSVTGGNVSPYLWPLRVDTPAIWYRWLFLLLDMAIGPLVIFISTLYLVRLIRAGRAALTHEQLFAVGILFSAILFFNVPLAVLTWVTVELNVPSNESSPAWHDDLELPLRAMSECLVGPLLFFFVWCSIHSFRIWDRSHRLDGTFFFPKVLLATIYAAAKLLLYLHLDITLSEVPLISGLAVLHIFNNMNFMRAYRTVAVAMVLFTAFEVLLLAVLVREMVLTTRALHRAPYMRHRAKHTGFRFFVYLHLVFFATYFGLHALLLLALPAGNQFILLLSAENFIFQVQDYTVGTRLLLLGYIVIWGYVNLPHDSVGAVKGWFKSTQLYPPSYDWGLLTDSDSSFDASEKDGGPLKKTPPPQFSVDRDDELNQEIVAPVVYRKMESKKSLELKANCFTMQTHVIMFNFAWYSYYYDTPKFHKFDSYEQKVPFHFKVYDKVYDEATDTRGLVIDASDRIIVTFKGSTSYRNLRTSLSAFHERLLHVVPSGECDKGRLEKMFGLYYDAAKIHKGFALAYSSVSRQITAAIAQLHEQHARPIFLTGHSLGGALATICALDLWIKLRISRRHIFVSTFGAPRIGNDAFSRIYNSVIVLHWRVVVDPDMITKLPKGQYRHVGKEAMLTQQGDLVIDPNAFERKLWSGTASGLAFHRKASYLLAMTAWCMKHHRRTYTPDFWKFNISKQDKQRFETPPPTSGRSNAGQQLAERIAKMISLVDSLVSPTEANELGNLQAIDAWARLAKGLVFRDRAAAGENAGPSSEEIADDADER